MIISTRSKPCLKRLLSNFRGATTSTETTAGLFCKYAEFQFVRKCAISCWRSTVHSHPRSRWFVTSLKHKNCLTTQMAWFKSLNFFFRKFPMSTTRRICLTKAILSKIHQLEKSTMGRFKLGSHWRKINTLTIVVYNQMLMEIQQIVFTDEIVWYHRFLNWDRFSRFRFMLFPM